MYETWSWLCVCLTSDQTSILICCQHLIYLSSRTHIHTHMHVCAHIDTQTRTCAAAKPIVTSWYRHSSHFSAVIPCCFGACLGYIYGSFSNRILMCLGFKSMITVVTRVFNYLWPNCIHTYTCTAINRLVVTSTQSISHRNDEIK